MSTAPIDQLSGDAQATFNAESQASAAMRRLPFRLQDFTRISWASDAAREVWQARIGRISNAWLEIEWLAVAAGLRSCCITTASPEQFLERAPRWAQNGLAALPIAMGGVTASYSSTPVAVEPGKPFTFRMVLGAPQDVTRFKQAWDASDDRGIGTLLGYPNCCREFFKRVWVDEAMVDTTWPMALATPGAKEERGQSPFAGTALRVLRTNGDCPLSSIVEVDPLPKANILWRWMGVRPVSHLPCSFACEATIELADRLIDVGRKQGFGEEMDWLLEILDWPVEWSALHGVAEIKTPILKVSTRTDATPSKYTVRYKGRSTPAEAVQGLRFPYLASSSQVLTQSDAFRRGLENPIGKKGDSPHLCAAPGGPFRQMGTVPFSPPWYAADNGFSTVAAMDQSHEPIVKAANPVLAERSGMVLDLGCGNGALLKKLLEANPSIVPFGIDVDAGRIAHARELLPQVADNFVAGNLFDVESVWPEGRRYTLALVMPGRLLETTPDRAAQLRARLQQQCDRILIYAYGDWLTRYGSLAGLAAAAGFRLVDAIDGAATGFAEVIEADTAST